MNYIEKLNLQTEEIEEVENLEKHKIIISEPFSVNKYNEHTRDFLALDGDFNDGFKQLKETDGLGISCIVSKEVKEAREDVNGNFHTRLKERIDSEVNNINASLNNIKNEGIIYIDDFEGTDTEKLQQAYNKMIEGEAHKTTIIINREIFITSPIYNNKESSYKCFRILGQGGTINIQFSGFLFDSNINNNSRNAPMFQNIRFKTKDNFTPCVINGDKYIRTMFDTCQFDNVSCVHTNHYLQTLRLHNCEIGSLSSNFIDASMAYDCVISECRFEQHTSTNKAINIQEKRKDMGISYLSLRIVNNLFEGYYYATAVNLGTGYGLVFNGNYFEANKENLTFSVGYGSNRTSGEIIGNIFSSTKNTEKTSIKFNDISNSLLKVESNTSNDTYLSDKALYKDVFEGNNNMYGGGSEHNVEGIKVNIGNSGRWKCEIKENPKVSGRVIFKFPTEYWDDIFNNVCGNYLISVVFGFGSSVQYRGSATILVSTGNVWLNGKMTKTLNYKVLTGVATNSTNGYNGTDFEDVKVYWNETEQTSTTRGEDVKFITVDISNTDINRKELYKGSMTNLNSIVCSIVSNY